MCVRVSVCHTGINWSGEKGFFQQDMALNNGDKPILMHFLYGLMVAGSLKTVSITEQFCSVTQRVKTDVTLNQLDKAQFREADLHRVSKALLPFIDQESLCQIQQNDETRSSVGPNGQCVDTHVCI